LKRPLLAAGWLVAAALAPGCGLMRTRSDDPRPVLRGPVPSRTLEAVKLTYLEFRPRRAATQPDGTALLSVISEYANTYQNGHSATDDVVFDSEISHTAFSARVGLGPKTDLEVAPAITYATDGCLDQLIEEYHKWFGFPSEGRHSRPLNSYEMEARHDGVLAYELDGNEIGLGDLPILLTQEFLAESESAPTISARVGVELPTGSESKGFGNGKVDYGGGVLAEKSFGRWSTTAAVDYSFNGTSKTFESANVSAHDNLDLQFGIEYRWNDDVSLLLGSILESPVTRDIEIKEINGEILSIDVGVAWDTGPRSRLLLDFGEDAIAKAGPDITFMAAWSFSP
jgi:Protein of unknown function (DUF3187)